MNLLLSYQRMFFFQANSPADILFTMMLCLMFRSFSLYPHLDVIFHIFRNFMELHGT